MGKWSQINRYTLEITCADSIFLLKAITSKGIDLHDIYFCNDLTFRCSIEKKDYETIADIAFKNGANIKLRRISIASKFIKAIARRPVLTCFAIVMLFASFYLPSRVLFVSVKGNDVVPTNRIIEAAENCGICFGASRRQVRSEKIKNALLQEIPQLQWAGVNTVGCTAVISVKEKTTQNITKNKEKAVASIVASRDGIIQNCTVYQGNPLCSVGQAVKAGEILVSGYVDCGIITKATQANAEIEALTFRQINVVAPAATQTRGELLSQKTVYSIKIGKKLINFSKDSGNIHTTCAKIYLEKFLQFPGGFQLPLGIVKQTVLLYGEADNETPTTQADWLDDFACEYLRKSMVAGQIISAQTNVETGNSAYNLYGKYACMEMIGKVKYEQIITKDDIYD